METRPATKLMQKPVTSVSHGPDANGRIPMEALRPLVTVEKSGFTSANIRFGFYGYAAEVGLDEAGITDLVQQLTLLFPALFPAEKETVRDER